MRWLVAILFILLGAFLFSFTIDDMGKIGRVIMKTIGIGCFVIAILLSKIKKKQNNHAKQTEI
ncbi:hypothetical protein RCG24_10465 [Neobacillus sp. OS1-32]|uniref:DUF1328 domain-containing protein n=1 Tax=Neobacillus paridis TaxID=2803862 RepID=A0ABS1TS45_9BACI|nr:MULTISPECIES: hypothetical protein [Neobacillus]MBL4953988.1 hypothetical protein [Neobacillus paridis]WML32225.1 hypothetical protein RCG24_10465 [Neobacillus sp. OS1-32]